MKEFVCSISQWLVENFLTIVATLAAISAYYSAKYAREANEQNKKTLERQSIIDLHSIWKEVNDINTDENGNIIYNDVQKAVNALELTSVFWNRDIIEKEIIFGIFWDAYKLLYEKLNSTKQLVPGTSKPCQNLVFDQIATAYNSMKTYGGKNGKEKLN